MHGQGDFMARQMNILDSRAISQALPNNDGTYKAICFTTPNLKALMGTYPEVLEMDITISLNIHRYNSIHIVCVDRSKLKFYLAGQCTT